MLKIHTCNILKFNANNLECVVCTLDVAGEIEKTNVVRLMCDGPSKLFADNATETYAKCQNN